MAVCEIIYWALESERTRDYQYYYFAGYNHEGKPNETYSPSEALAFHRRKDAIQFLNNNPKLTGRYNVVSMITNERPHYYEND